VTAARRDRPAATIGRRAALRLLAAGAASALVGCTRPEPPPPPPDRLRFEGTGPIVFASGPDLSLDGQRRRWVLRWNDLHRDQEVTYVELHSRADLQRAELLASLQSDLQPGQGGYDVLGLDVVWTAEFARDGHIVPLTSIADALGTGRFLPQVLETARFRGDLWAVPLNSNAGLLYYRTDLIAVPPRSWEQLAEQADEAWHRHRVDGYVAQLARYEGLTVNVAEAIWGQGGELVEGEGVRATADQQAAVDGLAFLAGGLERGWIPQAALNYTEEDCRRRFQQRGAAFMRNWPYAYGLLAARDSPVRGRFQVAPLPGARGAPAAPGASALGGMNLAISKGSRNQRTALEFIQFMVSERTETAVFGAGGDLPVLSAVYEDPAVRAKLPYIQTLRDAMAEARSRPVTPYYGQVTRLIQDAAYGVLHDGREPAEAMRQLAASLRDALQGR
jgi:multiple sugar transport system substrate-binding protein